MHNCFIVEVTDMVEVVTLRWYLPRQTYQEKPSIKKFQQFFFSVLKTKSLVLYYKNKFVCYDFTEKKFG